MIPRRMSTPSKRLLIMTISRAYDDNGNITEIHTGDTLLYKYTYDYLGQLTREDNVPLNESYVFEYDNAGNILTKKTYSYSTGAELSSVSYSYNDDSWGDLLTNFNGSSITYDAIGNPLSYYNASSYTFTWKNGRQLATVSSDDFELEFVYNDEGIRTQKIVNGSEIHTYHLSGSQIISEEWGNNLIIYLYDSNGSPIRTLLYNCRADRVGSAGKILLGGCFG